MNFAYKISRKVFTEVGFYDKINNHILANCQEGQ